MELKMEVIMMYGKKSLWICMFLGALSLAQASFAMKIEENNEQEDVQNNERENWLESQHRFHKKAEEMEKEAERIVYYDWFFNRDTMCNEAVVEYETQYKENKKQYPNPFILANNMLLDLWYKPYLLRELILRSPILKDYALSLIKEIFKQPTSQARINRWQKIKKNFLPDEKQHCPEQRAIAQACIELYIDEHNKTKKSMFILKPYNRIHCSARNVRTQINDRKIYIPLGDGKKLHIKYNVKKVIKSHINFSVENEKEWDKDGGFTATVDTITVDRPVIIDENTYAIPLFFSPTKQYCIFGSRNPLLIIINGTKVTSVPIGNIVIEQDSEIHVSWLDNVTFLLTNKHTQGAFERNYIGNVDDIEKNKMRIQLNPIWENEKNRNFHVLDYEGILDYEDRGDQAARFIFHAISGYEDRTYCTNGSPMVDDLFPNDILFPLSMEYMILLQDLEQSIKESPASVKSAFKELKNYPENEVDFFEGFL